MLSFQEVMKYNESGNKDELVEGTYGEITMVDR